MTTGLINSRRVVIVLLPQLIGKLFVES